MRLWPETLFGRTALIIALSLVIAQFTFLFLVRLSFTHVHVRQIALLISDEAQTIQAAERFLSPAQRRAFEAHLRPLGVRFETQAKAPTAIGPFGRALTHQLTNGGLPAEITTHKDSLNVSVATQGRSLSVHLPGLSPMLPWPRIGFLIVGSLLAGLGALLIVRRVNRPLAELASAAMAFGHGENPPPLSGEGPIEVRRVSAAFNQMTEAARRYERDRALLLAGVSHDLRTPLARMRLAVELALACDPGLRLGMIQDVEEMDGILAEFLAYARHGVEEVPITGQLAGLIKDIVLRYNRQGQAIVYDSEPLPDFAYRPLATGRLIGNLVDNAVSHGRPPIHIQTFVAAGFVHIVITDRGPGLTERQRTHLLSAIELNTGNRRGLGLAIARRIAEAHGGTIQLRNREGGGLEVLVRLPLREPALLEGAASPHTHGL
ncbi:MAG TPA: ATP-binding protein [Acidiferrobacter sp.]|nr:ATP-binding protein [Acidiferrobacter sp.]